MTSKNERKFIQYFLILSSCSFFKRYELLSARGLTGLDSFDQTKTSNVCDLTAGHKLLIMDFVILCSCNIFYDRISEYTGLSVQSCVLCIAFVDDIHFSNALPFVSCHVLVFNIGVIFELFFLMHKFQLILQINKMNN